MAQLFLTLVTPDKKGIEKTEISQVTFNSAEGQIQILPGHTKMVGILETGVFAFTPVSGAPVSGVISFGFFEVSTDQVHIMAQTFERKDEIDAARAKAAAHKAQESLGKQGLSEENFNKYQLKLQRALIRQQASGRLDA